jgi:hypothetical protein
MTTGVMLFPIFVRQGKSRTRFKVGYINQTGNVVIDPKYDEGTNFYEGLASVKVGNRWGIINFAGDFLIQPSTWGWCRFREGLASISVKGKWGIIDRRGEFVVTPRYDYIGPFRDGLAVFGLGEANHRRYGFLNKNGSEAIPPVFHDAEEFSEGLAAVRVGELWGYVATSGVFQITPQFDGSGKGKRWPDTRAGRFVEGFAPVWVGQDQYRFIDTTGAFAFDVTFGDANSFCESRAVVEQHNRYGFIDTDGMMVIECRFSLVRDFSEGLARVKEGENKLGTIAPSGFIDSHGKMVLPPYFYSAASFRNGLCFVETEDSIGYIDRRGEFVWQGPHVEYGVLL